MCSYGALHPRALFVLLTLVEGSRAVLRMQGAPGTARLHSYTVYCPKPPTLFRSGRLAGSLLGLFPEAEAVWGVARDADGHTPQDYAYMRAFNYGAAAAAASNGADSAAASGSAGAASASSWPRADATTAAISSVPLPVGSGGGGGGGGSALAPLLAASNAISGPSAPTQTLAMAPALQPLGAAVSPMHLAGGARWQQLLPAQQQQQQQQQQPAQQQAPAQQPTELDAVSGGTPRAIRGAVAAAVAAAGGRGASGAGFHTVQYYRDFDGCVAGCLSKWARSDPSCPAA